MPCVSDRFRLNSARAFAALLVASCLSSSPPVQAEQSLSEVLSRRPPPGCAVPGINGSDPVASFASDLQALFAQLPGVSGSAAKVTNEALSTLANDPLGSELLCDRLREQPTVFGELAAARNALAAPDSCFSNALYVALLSVQHVLSGIVTLLEANCSALACAPPQPTGPPPCVIGCAALPAAQIVLLPIELTLALDDKCSFGVHEELMGEVRTVAPQWLASLRNSLNNALTAAADLQSDGAQEPALEEHNSAINEGFDGGGANLAAAAGLDRQAADLDAAVRAQIATQRAFEALSLEATVESLLADPSGAVNLLQIPSAFGGLLEQLREVVAARIQDFTALGRDTSRALAFFRAGDLAFNAGQNKAASGLYQQAYAALSPITTTTDPARASS